MRATIDDERQTLNDAKTIPPNVAALQVLLCAVWGLGQIATKVGNTGISPLYQAGLRSCLAVVLIGAWIVARRIPMHWRDGSLGWGLLIGTLFAFEFVCLYIGLAMTGAAHATVLLYTAPFFVALGAHWLVPNDRLNRRKVIGLALAFLGVVIAMQDRLGAFDRAAFTGDLLCLAAAMFWAATTVCVKATPLRSVVAEKNLLYQLAVSAPILLALSALAGEPGVHAATPLVWLAFAYQTVIVASASYLTWFFLVSRYRASALSTFTFLTPVFGVGFAWLLLGEPISLAILLSVSLIAAGIVFVNRA